MRNFFKWADKRMDYISIWDIGFLKWACMLFGILLAKIFPEFLLNLSYKFLIIVTIVLLIPVFKDFYFSKNKLR